MRRSALSFLVVLLWAPAAAHAADGDIIIQRQPGLNGHERAALRDDAGVELVATLPIARTELVKPADGDVNDALTALRADDDVVSAERDTRVVTTAAAPNDFYWTSLWGLSNSADTDIDAPEAWAHSLGAGVNVAVVDTGINFTHEDLVGQIAGNAGEQGRGRETNGVDDDHDGLVDDYRGWDFVSGDNLPQDGNGHGSHVAGTIAATGSNGAGLIGVAPQAHVVPIRVLDNDGSGWMSNIAAGFDYAADLGAPIVNASLGGGNSSVLENVIATHPHTLFVIAAGNANANNDVAATASYPCVLTEPNIVCVGASDQSDARAGFSNYGATTVDLSAPGVGILSAWKDSPTAYRLLNGTSMATPHVAGAAALALSANPAATAAQLKWALMSSVDVKPQLAGSSVTGGRLNADAAVAAITGQLPTLTADATPTPTATPGPTATPVAPIPTAPPVVPAPTPVPAGPVPTPAPTGSPVAYVSHVKVGGSLASKQSKLRVTFALNRASTVRFTIARHGKAVATWTRQGRTGANAVVLSRKLPTGRVLKPGSYTLAVGLTAKASASRAIRVR